jgi:hypothetical protein
MPNAAALLLIAALLLTAVATAHARPAASSRVRAADAGAGALVSAALTRSATVKRLVAEIEASDLIVYVAEADDLRSDLHGALRFMGTGASPDRYLRIEVRPGDPASPTSLAVAIATLAHELMHALEVAAAQHVVDEASFTRFFREVAHELRDAVVDTPAAREIGQRVHFELTGRKH